MTHGNAQRMLTEVGAESLGCSGCGERSQSLMPAQCPGPELASWTPEWSPIVFRHFAGLIAAALITPRLAAPIAMSARVDTGVGGPTS